MIDGAGYHGLIPWISWKPDDLYWRHSWRFADRGKQISDRLRLGGSPGQAARRVKSLSLPVLRVGVGVGGEVFLCDELARKPETYRRFESLPLRHAILKVTDFVVVFTS
jgi:hypothetical protein